MDKIDQAILKHLSNEKHLETALQVYQQFPKVHLWLVQEFWAAVEKELRTKAKENWRVKLNKPIKKIGYDNSLRLGYYLKGHFKDNIGVIFESLAHDVYYGLRAEVRNERIDKIGVSIRKKIEENERELEGQIKEEQNNVWPIRIFYGFNFFDPNALKHIFPANRAEMVQEFANNLFDLAETVEEHIPEITEIVKTNQ